MPGTTVAAAAAAVLRAAGVERAFAGPRVAPAAGGALRAAGTDVVDLADSHTAALAAALTAEIGGGAGVALLARQDVAAVWAAIAYARLERVPLVVVAAGGEDERGESRGAAGGADAEPGADRVLRARAASFKVTLGADGGSGAERLARALDAARAWPPGPVRVDADDDWTRPDPGGERGANPSSAVSPAASTQALDEAARWVREASRPVVVAGLGSCSPEVAAWLRPLAESLPAPVVTTAKAKGVMPEPHPLALGVLGSPPAAALLARADLLIALAVDPIEVPAPAWPGAVAQLHVGPAAGALAADGTRPTLAVDAPIARVLEELAPRLRGGGSADWDVAELDRIKRAGRRDAAWPDPAAVARLTRELMPAGAFAAVDAFPHAPAVAETWQVVAPGEFATPAVFAPPGYAAVAAVAAALARPGQPALAFAAPTSLAAAAPALALAAAWSLPVAVLALGDAGALDDAEIPGARPASGARDLEVALAGLLRPGGARPVVLAIGAV